MPTPTPSRDRAHILMVGATAPSHIYPSLALIRELVRRGHRVSYAVGAPVAELIEPTGAELLACTTLLPTPGGAREQWPEEPAAGMRLFLDEAIHVLPQLHAAFGDDDRPDLILHDIGGMAGPVAGLRWGVPTLELSPTYVAWEGYEEDMAEFMDELRASPAGQELYRVQAEWLRENGVTGDPERFFAHRDRSLVLIPRAMQPNGDRVAPSKQFLGPCLDEDRIGAPGWSPPASGKPVVFVSFGTAYNDQLDVYRDCLEAFADGAFHLLLSIGPQVDPAALGPLPEFVEVHRSVPQLTVLEHASAFVTHAGMGSVTEALWFGVPMVAIPQAVDQFVNGPQIEELGVGRHLPADEVTAETLGRAVREVLADPEIGTRVTEVRAEVRAQGGRGPAADAVEAALAEAREDRGRAA